MGYIPNIQALWLTGRVPLFASMLKELWSKQNVIQNPESNWRRWNLTLGLQFTLEFHQCGVSHLSLSDTWWSSFHLARMEGIISTLELQTLRTTSMCLHCHDTGNSLIIFQQAPLQTLETSRTSISPQNPNQSTLLLKQFVINNMVHKIVHQTFEKVITSP